MAKKRVEKSTLYVGVSAEQAGKLEVTGFLVADNGDTVFLEEPDGNYHEVQKDTLRQSISAS